MTNDIWRKRKLRPIQSVSRVINSFIDGYENVRENCVFEHVTDGGCCSAFGIDDCIANDAFQWHVWWQTNYWCVFLASNAHRAKSQLLSSTSFTSQEALGIILSFDCVICIFFLYTNSRTDSSNQWSEHYSHSWIVSNEHKYRSYDSSILQIKVHPAELMKHSFWPFPPMAATRNESVLFSQFSALKKKYHTHTWMHIHSFDKIRLARTISQTTQFKFAISHT